MSWLNKKSFAIFLFSLFLVQGVQSQVGQKLTNTLGQKLVQIPAGNFYMGSLGKGENYDEKPIHKVVISKPFYMSTTEVTNKQYEEFDNNHRKYREYPGMSINDDDPVTYVSYYDAVAFCEWLSKKENKNYRLPTESEWEYACRAGSYFDYSMGSKLPPEQQKSQTTSRNIPRINLLVAQFEPNLFGLYDMHGNVEEWCSDWYGAYPDIQLTDPVGPVDGMYRVTRGGSFTTPLQYLRSANRMAMLPDNKHWLTGFRIVQAEPLSSNAYKLNEEVPVYARDVTSNQSKWDKKDKRAIFNSPIPYVLQPDCDVFVPFYEHNHCPTITWCDNGDLIAAWFSTDIENGREMVILASRLRNGQTNWDKPSLFFKVPDRNMTGSSLFNTSDGRIIFINGVGSDGDWKNLTMVERSSYDNGSTWTTPRTISSSYDIRNQVITGMIQTKKGALIQLADATPNGEGGTAIHISNDKGKTWTDPAVDRNSRFIEGGTGGNIAGIHATVVELNNGNLMAFGRGNAIEKEGEQRMPMSISKDMGKSWTYYASEFPSIGSGQRAVILRLNEGPILFVSFTNKGLLEKTEQPGMVFINSKGEETTGYGLFAALSFDEGKTWSKKKLLTDGEEKLLNGGAWTGLFIMDKNHAEHRGYLAITQSPDNMIHLLSSNLYYSFNLKWLLE